MKTTNIPDLGPFFTFTPSKSKPIYNWFFYKEAYSPEAVEYFLNKFQISSGTILDPFCGIGTTLLYSKFKGLNSIGYDASPLSVFASRVKCADYSQEDISFAKETLQIFSERVSGAPPIIWKPELFQAHKIFSTQSLTFILKARSAVESIENEKVRDLFLLGLLSIIPQCCFLMKDGGVLKIDKRKSCPPAKPLFNRRIKEMISDLDEIGISSRASDQRSLDLENSQVIGPLPRIEIGDARKIPLKDNSIDAIITSPPYLNGIDYTKIYGLELSLLEPYSNSVREARGRSLYSFEKKVPVETVPPEAEEFGHKYPIIGGYFSDMEKVLKESHRLLKPNSSSVFIVGNSIMFGLHILVDEILAEIGERIGFEAEIISSLQRFASTPHAKVETRESAIVLKKH